MAYIAYLKSPVGFLKIESDGAFLNSVLFVDNFDQSMLVNSADCELNKTIEEQLEEYFNGNREAFDIPIQMQGTSFQKEVWSNLQEIPYGKTISYLQLAKNLQNEKAIRAVGSANGKNKFAIIVPCHRVIGADGSLTGYAGGLWRKKWLLEHERKISGKPTFTQMSIF
ncbi:MAG: methylated-DNA--[protein]-cysteine S-methyltransferase [Saprospiraceae bacterium]